jgi:hypothetical protein
MNTSLIRAGVPALLVLLLAACGGGGGGSTGGGPDVQPLPTPPGRVSLTSPVAAGCVGGAATGGTAYVNAEVEPMLARHPTQPALLAAAWQQDRWSDGAARALVSASSDDGGNTWRHTLHPFSRCGGAAAGSAGDHERATDPWVDIGSDGTLHMMALATSGAALAASSRNAMLARRSTDGGRTWSAVQVLQQDTGSAFNDKNTLTVDALDPRFVYATWDRLSGNRGPAMLARSTDAGLTWEPARVIHDPTPPAGGNAQTIGNRIVVVPAGPQRGVLVNIFTQIESGPAGGNVSNTVRAMRSADRGLTWSVPVVVADHRGIGARDPTTGTAIRDGSIIPAVAAAPDGTLWLAWQDSRFSGGVRDAIAVSRSSDGGQTWSAPVAASNSGNAAAFTPTLHVRDDGLVGLLYFDLRPDTTEAGTLLAAVWLATTRDGVLWGETSVWNPFDMTQAPNARGLFLGDYMGMASSDSRFLPLVVVSGLDTNNRTDVYLIATVPAAGTPAAASSAGALVVDDAAFNARRAAFTREVMERRVPGWSQRAGILRAP